jgi:hypothetical protein
MDVLRVYTTSENREKLEKAARKILGTQDYSEKISV